MRNIAAQGLDIVQSKWCRTDILPRPHPFAGTDDQKVASKAGDLLRHLERAATVAQEIKQPLSAEILNQTIAAGAKLLTIEKD